MNAKTIHMELAEACAASAIYWRGVAVTELERNLPLAIFAYNCALDNERIAEDEKKFLPVPGR